MRLTSLLCCLMCGLAGITAIAPPARGNATFPYKAYVTADDVYIRSGPGKNYYPTDKTKAGQMVEVYRHDPGGWCAIRPPKGSFTWVSTRYLRSNGAGLVKVTSPRVAARVGSRFSDIRDIIQVRLHEDEALELLDDRLHADRPWTRVAPPSGEFRWVHIKYLDPDYPVNGVRKRRPPIDHGRHEAERPVEPTSFDEPTPERAAAPPRRDRAKQSRPLSVKDFKRQIEELNLELSVMVAEEPTVWHFDEMALDAEHLIAQAETALERGRARMLLSKIERFENIKQRYDMVEHVVADVDRRNRRLAALSNRNDPTRTTRLANQFDGQGRLARVRSPKPGMPQYALVDESGRIKCYVTPSPGMSLRHYEQRNVGITGTRGYMPEQRARHIMAKHIDLLGDRVIR